MTATADLRQQKSTTVRFFSAPMPVRAAFGVLNRAAPALAARWAERIWFTLPRPTAPPRAVPVPGGRRFTVEVEGSRLAGEVWGAGPAVYLVHGWGGRGGQLASFVAPLVARGWSVVTFDAPGHGDSGERQATIPDVVATIHAVAAADPPIRGVIAHSIGAAATARAVYEGCTVGALVFVGPPADLVTPSLVFAEELGLSRRVRQLMQRRVEQRVGMPWEAFDVTRLAPCQTAPLLIVHDRGDAEVPWQHGAAIASAWPGSELLTTDGDGRDLVLDGEEVLVGLDASRRVLHRPPVGGNRRVHESGDCTRRARGGLCVLRPAFPPRRLAIRAL